MALFIAHVCISIPVSVFADLFEELEVTGAEKDGEEEEEENDELNGDPVKHVSRRGSGIQSTPNLLQITEGSTGLPSSPSPPPPPPSMATTLGYSGSSQIGERPVLRRTRSCVNVVVDFRTKISEIPAKRLIINVYKPAILESYAVHVSGRYTVRYNFRYIGITIAILAPIEGLLCIMQWEQSGLEHQRQETELGLGFWLDKRHPNLRLQRRAASDSHITTSSQSFQGTAFAPSLQAEGRTLSSLSAAPTAGPPKFSPQPPPAETGVVRGLQEQLVRSFASLQMPPITLGDAAAANPKLLARLRLRQEENVHAIERQRQENIASTSADDDNNRNISTVIQTRFIIF